MNLTTLFATISLASLVAAAPISNNHRRNLIPTPAQVIETLFPHSGVPRIAAKLDKVLNVCKCNAPKDKINLD